MKIIRANAGVLTNFEVLDFLRSRGTTSDPLNCLGAAAASECKVFDYLVHSAACNQTRETIDKFMKGCEKFKLSKAEVLNIINLRPSSQAHIYPLIESCSSRSALNEDANGVQDLVDLVVEVLPPPPAQPDAEMPDQQEE